MRFDRLPAANQAPNAEEGQRVPIVGANDLA